MNDMKQVGGVWLPGHEQHMVEWMQKRNQVVDGKLTYQYHKLDAAMKFVKRFGIAMDVGAHVGLWSMHLIKKFEHVLAFEPVQLHRQCFERNMEAATNFTLHGVALGETEGTVRLTSASGSSGDTRIATEGEKSYLGFERQRLTEEVPLLRLDHLFPQTVIDFIKLDCEGYELFALRGGEELLKRSRPCVCVEQKPGFAARFGMAEQAAVNYLQGLGAKLRKEIAGDFILSWD